MLGPTPRDSDLICPGRGLSTGNFERCTDSLKCAAGAENHYSKGSGSRTSLYGLSETLGFLGDLRMEWEGAVK